MHSKQRLLVLEKWAISHNTCTAREKMMSSDIVKQLGFLFIDCTLHYTCLSLQGIAFSRFSLIAHKVLKIFQKSARVLF